MDVAAVEFLLSPPGRELLRSAAAYDGHNTLALSAQLRSSYDAEQVAAALTQLALRRRAVPKFGTDAEVMFYTSDGLEQATHRLVAQHRATRSASTGARTVLDLGCGVGGDSIALLRAGLTVQAVDHDPVTARIAAANLSALNLAGNVAVASAVDVPLDGPDLVYADPSRRKGGRRVFDPQAFSPPWSFVDQVLQGNAVVKLAPGLPHALIPEHVEAEWVSLDGQLREAALWSPRQARCLRRATVLTTQSRDPHRAHVVQLTDRDDPGRAEVRTVGCYLYEPDDAVIRAHLVTAFADRVHGWLLDPHLAYVSSDELTTTGLGRAYRVVEVLPFREKILRAALRARDVGALTIKKRGVQITPETLRARLGLKGSQPATVILSRTPRSALALLVEPLGTGCLTTGEGGG